MKSKLMQQQASLPDTRKFRFFCQKEVRGTRKRSGRRRESANQREGSGPSEGGRELEGKRREDRARARGSLSAPSPRVPGVLKVICKSIQKIVLAFHPMTSASTLKHNSDCH
ncbi:hypothetical protein NDU88_004747 [Pleurodeles waltl]|uniref:Uncharacterized protein n=1 Tax=Pleurodeles waltl TaxID=8319 RepID=A0AAV7QDV2_PLEWA|nr:hypothetical protein NDU88_004747 [Pleurodeles waltl]